MVQHLKNIRFYRLVRHRKKSLLWSSSSLRWESHAHFLSDRCALFHASSPLMLWYRRSRGGIYSATLPIFKRDAQRDDAHPVGRSTFRAMHLHVLSNGEWTHHHQLATLCR